MASFTGTSGGRDKVVRGSFAEPCTVEAKMVQGEVSVCSWNQNGDHTGRSPASWENLRKGLERIWGGKHWKIQIRECLRGGPSTALGRPREEVGQFERQPACSPNQKKYMED